MWVGLLSLMHAQNRQPGSWLSFMLLSVHLVETISTRQLVVIHAAISPFSGSSLLSPVLYYLFSCFCLFLCLMSVISVWNPLFRVLQDVLITYTPILHGYKYLHTHNELLGWDTGPSAPDQQTLSQ